MKPEDILFVEQRLYDAGVCAVSMEDGGIVLFLACLIPKNSTLNVTRTNDFMIV